jgi:hypothetical protein
MGIIKESKYFEKKQIKNFMHLINEYEKIKAKKHKIFKTVKEFYITHNVSRQIFNKYYNRYKQNPSDFQALLPQKRGPKFRTRRKPDFIIDEVISFRKLGNNKYEIANMLKPKFKGLAPSASTVYNILKKEGLNILSPKIKETKRKIIKMKAGELGHVDCYHLNKLPFLKSREKHYLVGLTDDCTRITLCEKIDNLKSLTVMFALLRLINIFNEIFGIKFSEILTDNGAEFGSIKYKNKDEHPVEIMFKELGIKHRYTRPYRPQTNGKIERFWRTLYTELIEDTDFENIEEFKSDLDEYLCYYNYQRSHQSLGGKTPFEFLQTVEKVN